MNSHGQLFCLFIVLSSLVAGIVFLSLALLVEMFFRQYPKTVIGTIYGLTIALVFFLGKLR